MLISEPRHLLTIPEVAKALNLSTATVRRRITEGEIPAVRLGSGPQAPVRVDPRELEAWLYGFPAVASSEGEVAQ